MERQKLLRSMVFFRQKFYNPPPVPLINRIFSSTIGQPNQSNKEKEICRAGCLHQHEDIFPLVIGFFCGVLKGLLASSKF